MSKKKETTASEATVEETALDAGEALDAVDNVTTDTTEATESVKNDGFCIYLGPSITRVIRHGKMYRGTKEDVLASLGDAVNKYPLIADLLVEDKSLSEDRIKIKTPGNLLYINYHKLAKSLRNGG